MGDADITLRHIVRRRPEELAKGLMTTEQPIEIVGWTDSQVTALERRLDGALKLRVDGELLALDPEFTVELDKELPYRIFEYHALLVMALRAEAPGELPPPVEHVTVVLRGRKEPLPDEGLYRTGWRKRAFSGVHFRIDAVYQRTVEELRARGGVLWLVFAPLARDATVEAMRQVIEGIRGRVPDDEERAELYTAMLVLADLDPWGHTLREEIAAMLESRENRLIMESKTLRDAFERGIEKGIEKGIERGIERGIENMLRRLFARRLGRALTEAEQQELARRARELGPERVEDAGIDLSGDALAAWLRDPSAR